MAELKSSTMTNGEQFAMIIGTSMTPTWFADSLAFQGWLPMPTLTPIMAKGLDLFGWMTWRVQVASHISTIADKVDGAPIIAFTAKTRACVVDMAHLTFVWSVVVITMAELKFTTMGHGAQCVMMLGTSMMPMLCVASLDSPAQLTSTKVRIMAKAPGEFGWII